ncbi:DUF4139 domain-containing protein [Chloroflexota bacterium]
MFRRWWFIVLWGVVCVGIGLVGSVSPAWAQDGAFMFTYESQPDAVALYQGDLAYIRDEVTIPAGMTAHIILPPSTMRESLVMTEAGERVRSYRYRTAGVVTPPPVSAPHMSAALSSMPLPVPGMDSLAITLDATDAAAPREIVLSYLAHGAGWEPLYDMDVLSPESVVFGFDALIHNHALSLQAADLRLVAGMPGADPNYRPDMTVTQMNVLYEEPLAAPAAGGPVAINHVYDLGPQTIWPGETLRRNMVYEPLAARRLIVWDARFGQRTDVIYKVTNSSALPFVAGPVSAYEDSLYVGTDAIEWTPVGSEGSLTIGGLSSVRVRKTESVEDIGTRNDDRYLHTVTLALTNHAGEDLDVTVLDEWYQYGQNFIFSEEPTRQGNNVLRWEVTIPAGEKVEIAYTYIVD